MPTRKEARWNGIALAALVAITFGSLVVVAARMEEDDLDSWSAAVSSGPDAGTVDASDGGPCDCDDNDPCTEDFCTSDGCAYTCVDSDECQPDTCSAELCREGGSMPSCDDIRAHNQEILDNAGEEFIEGPWTLRQVFGYYEKQFQGQLVTAKNGFTIAGATVTAAELTFGYKDCGPLFCKAVGSNQYKTKWRLVPKAALSTTAAAIAAAAAWYHVYNVYNDINDNKCRLKKVYSKDKYRAGAESLGTTACEESTSSPCSSDCDSQSCSMQSDASEIDVLSTTKESLGWFFKNELEEGDCWADWVDDSQCADADSQGFCIVCGCGDYTQPATWYDWDDGAWNILKAKEICRIETCTGWADATFAAEKP